jgi:hypothetical protein
MATYQLPDGRTVSTDLAFTLDEIQYPSNWLALSTFEEREKRDIKGPLPEPPWYDQRFYWKPDQPKDHAQLVAEYIGHVKRNAGAMLSDTDWMVTRSAEPGGKPVSAAVLAQRAGIRAKSDDKEAFLAATETTDELAAYVTGPSYSDWSEQQTTTTAATYIPGGSSSDQLIV